MNSGLLEIRWLNRTESLAPTAVVTFGDSAVSMAVKLLSLDDEKLQNLQGVAAKRMILLTGEAEFLPWTDGALYLGRDPLMPSILLPTTLQPNMPFDLFQRALNENFQQFAPFAVLPDKIIPFGKAKTLSRQILDKWLAENNETS